MRGTVIAVALASALALDASAQAPNGKDVFKGRIKPGLYEQRDDVVMRGYDNVPPDKERATETKKRCISAEEIAQGIEVRSDCKFTTVKETPTSVSYIGSCPGGTKEEFSIDVVGSGFKSRVSSTGKSPAGKPMEMSMVSEAKYLGACK